MQINLPIGDDKSKCDEAPTYEADGHVSDVGAVSSGTLHAFAQQVYFETAANTLDMSI